MVGQDTNDGSMWLLNDTTENEDVSARELFGFNTGTFAEVVTGPSTFHQTVCFYFGFIFISSNSSHNLPNISQHALPGDAATATDQIPWLVNTDLQVVCLVLPDKKELMTICDVMAYVTRNRGVTQVSLLDHDMAPLMKDENKSKTVQTLKNISPYIYPFII